MEVSDQLHPQAALAPVLGVCVGFRATLDIAGDNQNLLLHWLSKPSQANQAKVLTGGGDLREAQVDVPLSVSHSRV